MKNTLIQLPSGDWILPSSAMSVVLKFADVGDGAKNQAFVHVTYRTSNPELPCEAIDISTIRIPVATAEDGWAMVRQIVMDMGVVEQAIEPSRAMQRFYDFQDSNKFRLQIEERNQLSRTSDGRFYCHFSDYPRVLESDQILSYPSGNGVSPEAAIEAYARTIAGKKISQPSTGNLMFIQVPNFFD